MKIVDIIKQSYSYLYSEFWLKVPFVTDGSHTYMCFPFKKTGMS